jgi:hypothetical protein
MGAYVLEFEASGGVLDEHGSDDGLAEDLVTRWEVARVSDLFGHYGFVDFHWTSFLLSKW